MGYLITEQINDITKECENPTIIESFRKANKIINNPKYKNIICSISGGADSDVMLDLCYRVDISKKIDYVFFDTGLEYKATRDHLDYLENKYGIEISRQRPTKPIPYTTKHYGQPFLSKNVSEYIKRLQKHGFKWEDEPFDVLYKKYPKCKVALKWWCNAWGIDGRKSQFDISYNKYLKEFMIQNPPNFNISNICCKYAKKDVVSRYIKEHDCDLSIFGVRKAEGGARATAYKTCYSVHDKGVDYYRPLFWYSDNDREEYEKVFGITHSKCYTEYGLVRTGCVGCPYGLKLNQELEIIKKYEPNLYTATCNIFKDSYEYTKQYREFQKKQKELQKENKYND